MKRYLTVIHLRTETAEKELIIDGNLTEPEYLEDNEVYAALIQNEKTDTTIHVGCEVYYREPGSEIKFQTLLDEIRRLGSHDFFETQKLSDAVCYCDCNHFIMGGV